MAALNFDDLHSRDTHWRSSALYRWQADHHPAPWSGLIPRAHMADGMDPDTYASLLKAHALLATMVPSPRAWAAIEDDYRNVATIDGIIRLTPAGPPAVNSGSSSASNSIRGSTSSSRSGSPVPPLTHGTSADDDSDGSTNSVDVAMDAPDLTETRGLVDQLVVSHPPQVPCGLPFLGCGRIFHDHQSWDLHVTSHFNGNAPPRNIDCHLCADPDAVSLDWTAWCRHVRQHLFDGRPQTRARPGDKLILYLFNNRIISQAEMKRIVFAGSMKGEYRLMDTRHDPKHDHRRFDLNREAIRS